MEGDFRLGDCLIRPQLNQIVGSCNTTAVKPKSMEVMVYLAEHCGEVRSKEHIIGAVWPGTFVTDDVLKHAIFDLRKALEDDASEPRYIQTLPRRGYRLIAEVEAIEEAADHRYERREVLGKGAMGQVYLAQDRLLRRKVALKFLPERGEDDSGRKRLLIEARATAALDHSYNCKVYDTGEMEGRIFIAMESSKEVVVRDSRQHPLPTER